MAELKTQPNNRSVERFLNSLADEQMRNDCSALVGIMQHITKAAPKMWGTSAVGFGTYHYVYESGREGDWFVAGFSPRKKNLTIYLMGGIEPNKALLQKLGKHKTGRACLYIKCLEDIHLPTLKKLIQQSVARVRKKEKAPEK